MYLTSILVNLRRLWENAGHPAIQPGIDPMTIPAEPQPPTTPSNPPSGDGSRGMGLGMVIVAAAFWATSGLWASWILNGSGMSPVALAFWRDLTTFLVLAAGVTLIRPSLFRIRRQDIIWLALMGAIGVGIFHVLWNVSVVMNGAALATVLQYNESIVVTLSAWLLWREPLTGRKIMAIVLALGGTMLISFADSGGGIEVTAVGLAVGLASAIAHSVYNLLGKRLTGSYNPWTILTYVFGFGALVLLPTLAFVDPAMKLTPPVMAAFAGFIFVPTIAGFGLYTSGLGRLQASVATIVATVEVPFAALFAVVLLGERLGPWQLVGGIMVVAGVLLVSLKRRARRPVPLKDRP